MNDRINRITKTGNDGHFGSADLGGKLRPLKILLTAISAIFFAEMFMMLVLYLLPPIPPFYEALVDSFGLIVIILPILTILVYVPMTKQAQQITRDLAQIVEQSLNEIYIFDVETLLFVQVNQGACNNIGYSREELSRMAPYDLKQDYDQESFLRLLQPLKAGTKELVRFETAHRRKDGSCYDAEVHIQLSEFLNKPVFVAMILDITEKKRLQSLESRAERLETAGTIAGQVAHDFNNLLGPMMSYPDLIRDELPPNNRAHAYLNDIETTAQKLADMNQELLTLGRRGHYSQEILNLNTIVEQAAHELILRSETVRVDTDLADDLMNIKGGAVQIHRVLTNLLVNALDAISEFGTILLRSENYYADDTSIAFGMVPKGEYVKLTIADTGCGIPENVIKQMLDPFFSTKTADKKRGSGLGLSVVDSVMKDHNGYLDLDTKLGVGTSFYLYFPVTRERLPEDNNDILVGGTEKVLVIDDDEIQRTVSLNILTRLGYEVNAVESGEKAIENLKQTPHDIVILDMVMPDGIDGAETYRRILEFSPKQKAIILSGYSETDRVLMAQELGAGAFVKKPVRGYDIAVAVRAELDHSLETATS